MGDGESNDDDLVGVFHILQTRDSIPVPFEKAAVHREYLSQISIKDGESETHHST